MEVCGQFTPLHRVTLLIGKGDGAGRTAGSISLPTPLDAAPRMRPCRVHGHWYQLMVERHHQHQISHAARISAVTPALEVKPHVSKADPISRRAVRLHGHAVSPCCLASSRKR